MKEDVGDVEPGLDIRMCLIADAECIASVVDARSQEEEKVVPPFVKAVDVLPPLLGELSIRRIVELQTCDIVTS